MIELVVGGARSGKSRYALKAAEALSPRPVFVATATAEDAGMTDRIRRHREERGAHWGLLEVPFDLAAAIRSAGPEDVMVVDCLTLWISNWLCSADPGGWPKERAAFLAALTETRTRVFLVSNEVGMGVVPMGKLTREFVDQSGWLHQDVAALADRVTLMHFGIPAPIKDI